MSVFVDAFRHTMYDGRAPAAANIAGLFAAAALSMAFGLLVFSRGVRRLAEEV
jgi:ABC-type polysaccharide/polyol phosphate export permease